MRPIFLIFLNTFLCFISCSFVDNDIKKVAEKLLIGKWVLATDNNFVMDIRSDTIVYYYDGQVNMSNPIVFVLDDALMNYYEAKSSTFDFIRDGDLQSKILVKEFDVSSKDTIINTVVYLNKNGLDIISRNRSVSFRKQEK